jgi:uncharacterized cupin superfamily protein
MRSYDARVVPEAPLQATETGLIQAGPGWFVVNASAARWRSAEGRGSVCMFGDEDELTQVGFNLFVLAPSEPMGMYHWEADQEDFLVLSGEGLLIVEGEERRLRAWDFVHCPPGTPHIIVGAGDAPCVVLAVGAREHQGSPGWGGYTVDAAALRHVAGVERATTDELEAYAKVPHRQAATFREEWLPG